MYIYIYIYIYRSVGTKKGKKNYTLTLPRPRRLNPNLTPTINSNLIRNPNPGTPRTPLYLITRSRCSSSVPRNRYLRRHHLIIILPNLRPINETLAIPIAGYRTTSNSLRMSKTGNFCRA